MEDAKLELKFVGDIAGSFRVASYQRGYRWGTHEVGCLLKDIWESGGNPYDLQPVVVKRDGEAEWELVDGQQRLTTLYLIFQFMQREQLQNAIAPYSITYDTRSGSEKYLQTLDKERAKTNIDFFHLHNAYECIRDWFNSYDTRRQYVAKKFYEYLFQIVRVIWYEASNDPKPQEIFRRLNIGRIFLTDAELFKALLLTRNRDSDSVPDRRQEIAAQWDHIERDLHHPEVWAFVADDEAKESPTRITLLLDTIAGGPRGRARQRFHTFDALREKVDQTGAKAVWNEVVQLHAMVLGWYESRDYYHKVGYLVAVGQRFSDLVSLASGKAKSEFNALLDRRISETLKLAPSEVTELDYESNTQKCSDLLLLMNVETVRRMKDSSERYSFRIHRSRVWSLEHIHAQHAESLTKVEQWKEWLRLHRDALDGLPPISENERQNERQELLSRIKDVGDTIDGQTFQELARDVAAVFTQADSSPAAASHPVHAVSNLALLAKDHNSALSNAVFEVKRRRILEIDKEGAYIPICTRKVFLKYYTNADAQQIHFWSTQDREAYLEAILSIKAGVGAYLKPEEPGS